ncbi:MAG: YraN family protein [Acidimicrobiia bacterium]
MSGNWSMAGLRPDQIRDAATAEIGNLAEALAAKLIVGHRGRVVARNVRVGSGELDILALIDGEKTVVEVRSTRQGTGYVDPLIAFGHDKARQVRRLAGKIGAGRVDLITVRFSDRGVDLHWLPRVG